MPNKPARRGRESFSGDLLRHVDEEGLPDSIVGAEYFTVKATGQGGMSQSGLARFVGKSQSTISELIKKVREANPIGNDLSESLKPFAGMSLNLIGYNDPEGRDILEDGFCAAVVQHYACWSRDAKANTQAKLALKLIAHLGLRTLIHHKTGWQTLDTVDRRVVELEAEVQSQRALLEEAVAEMEGARSLSRTVHNAIHNQSGHLNRPIKKIREHLKTKDSTKRQNKKRK